MMRIISVAPLKGECVVIDSHPDDWTEYIRYSANNWACWMGESLEPIYHCADLEEAYAVYEAHKQTTPLADKGQDND